MHKNMLRFAGVFFILSTVILKGNINLGFAKHNRFHGQLRDGSGEGFKGPPLHTARTPTISIVLFGESQLMTLNPIASLTRPLGSGTPRQDPHPRTSLSCLPPIHPLLFQSARLVNRHANLCAISVFEDTSTALHLCALLSQPLSSRSVSDTKAKKDESEAACEETAVRASRRCVQSRSESQAACHGLIRAGGSKLQAVRSQDPQRN